MKMKKKTRTLETRLYLKVIIYDYLEMKTNNK